MRSPDNRNTRPPKAVADFFDFRANVLITSVMTAANPQMDRVGMHGQDPFDFFIQSVILSGKAAAAAAFHKSSDLRILLLVSFKLLCPVIESIEAAGSGANPFCFFTSQDNNSFHNIVPPCKNPASLHSSNGGEYT